MLEDLKKAIEKVQASTNMELVIACGFCAYERIKKELPLVLSDNNCRSIFGLPFYYLEWMPTDEIKIGGTELLIPPLWWKTKEPDTPKLPDNIVEQIKKYKMSDDLFPVVSESPPKFETIIKDTTEAYITQACIELKIDPYILQNQSFELKKQKDIIENTAEMLKNGKLLHRPCELGTTVYIVENAKMYQGTVIRYEQSLSPKQDTELLFADIEISGLNIIVRRAFKDFGKAIFVDSEDAKNKLQEQMSNK